MRRLPSCLVTALLLGTPAFAQEKAAEIDRIFSFATPETPGCAVGVSKGGQVVVDRAYGLADVERRVALSPRSVFDIGSTQKQFTAAAVLLLAQDGRLSLSDDIRKYLPELPDYGQTVTIDHLLTNTSGVRDWPGLLPMADEGIDVLKLVLRQPVLNFTPGDQWSYSSSGFELAKEIVARVSGMSFGEFAQRRLFEPLGMKSSAYVQDILHAPGERALAYQKEGAGWKPFMRLGNERAGGGVVTTARDLLIWNDALTNGRLGRSVTEKLQEPVTLNNGRRLKYARGLILDSIPGGRLVWHDGGASGFGTWLGRFTDAGLSLTVMCNFKPVQVAALVTRVADLFLPPVDPQAQPAGPVAVPGVEVSGREGLYFDARTGAPIRLVVNRGRLSIMDGPPLVPVSASSFRPPRPDLFYRSQDDFELIFRSDDEFDLRSMEGETARYRRAQPWMPTASDLQGIDGRYQNAELGPVFELLPGPKGLVWRFERSPDKAQEFEPVAPDTYLRGTSMVRFRRDGSGKVTGFDYTSSVLRLGYTRIGDRRASSPPAAVTKEPAPATPGISAPRLQELTGEYELAPGRTITVTLEQGQLHGELTNGAKLPLVHASGATFTVGRADAPVTLTFQLDARGTATGAVMRQNGQDRTLKKIR